MDGIAKSAYSGTRTKYPQQSIPTKSKHASRIHHHPHGSQKRLCARRSLVASQRPCHTGSNQARRLEMRISNSTDEHNVSHHRKGCNRECRHRFRKKHARLSEPRPRRLPVWPSVLYWDGSNIRRHAVHSRGRIWMSGRPAACALRLLGFALSAGLILIRPGEIDHPDLRYLFDSLFSLSPRGPHRWILKSVSFLYAAGIPMTGIVRPICGFSTSLCVYTWRCGIWEFVQVFYLCIANQRSLRDDAIHPFLHPREA